MNYSIFPGAAAALLLALACRHAAATGNAAAGAVVYEEECSECHTFNSKQKKGPTLRGIIGRKVGTQPDYDKYSEQVKKSNLVWTPEELDKYLANPRQYGLTVKMKYDGLSDARARADLIEFLLTKK